MTQQEFEKRLDGYAAAIAELLNEPSTGILRTLLEMYVGKLDEAHRHREDAKDANQAFDRAADEVEEQKERLRAIARIIHGGGVGAYKVGEIGKLFKVWEG